MAAAPEGEAEEIITRHTTSGKRVFTASSCQIEDMDEMLVDDDVTLDSQQRATTGGKTVMPTVPMHLTQSTATDVDDSMEHEDSTQEFQQRASTGGKTIMPTVPMPPSQSTETDVNGSMEDEDSSSESMDDDHSSESAVEEEILSEDISTDVRVRITRETMTPFYSAY